MLPLPSARRTALAAGGLAVGGEGDKIHAWSSALCAGHGRGTDRDVQRGLGVKMYSNKRPLGRSAARGDVAWEALQAADPSPNSLDPFSSKSAIEAFWKTGAKLGGIRQPHPVGSHGEGHPQPLHRAILIQHVTLHGVGDFQVFWVGRGAAGCERCGAGEHTGVAPLHCAPDIEMTVYGGGKLMAECGAERVRKAQSVGCRVGGGYACSPAPQSLA